MAVITRVGTPVFSSASCKARALITVASMPMWSAATRSIFIAAAETPRKKLPPPTTSPICTPVRATSAISCDKLFTRSGSMPKALPPAKTSPLSLRTMRWYFGMERGLWRLGLGGGLLGSLFDESRFPHFKSDEARDRNVLAQLGDGGFDQIADGGGVLANKGLLVEA